MKTVWICSTDIADIEREARRRFPLETGGVLVGYQTDNGNHSVITHVIGPGPNAEHRATRYLPDDEHDRRHIATIYEQSGRMLYYLGDWHTHPRGAAYLSRIDRATLKTIATSQSARIQRPLMLIAAGGADTWKLEVWQWTQRYALSRATSVGIRTFE